MRALVNRPVRLLPRPPVRPDHRATTHREAPVRSLANPPTQKWQPSVRTTFAANRADKPAPVAVTAPGHAAAGGNARSAHSPR